MKLNLGFCLKLSSILLSIYAAKVKLLSTRLNHEDLLALSTVCDRRTLPMGETPNAATADLHLVGRFW